MLLMAATGDPDAELVRGLCQGDRERAMTEFYDGTPGGSTGWA